MSENLERKLWLALCELNIKFHSAMTYKQHTDDNTDAEEWAAERVADDVSRIEKEWGVKLIYDGNYSMTWGVLNYGLYLTFDEVLDSRFEGGF